MMATTQPEMRVASVMLRRGVRNPRNAYVDLVCGARRQKPHIWGIVGMVDEEVSNTFAGRRAGSSPVSPTN